MIGSDRDFGIDSHGRNVGRGGGEREGVVGREDGEGGLGKRDEGGKEG